MSVAVVSCGAGVVFGKWVVNSALYGIWDSLSKSYSGAMSEGTSGWDG